MENSILFFHFIFETFPKKDIKKPSVAGLYRADGSYFHGRPVLQHEGGHFTLSVVEAVGVGG